MQFLWSLPSVLCSLSTESRHFLFLAQQTQTVYWGIIKELLTRWRSAGTAWEEQTVEMDTETDCGLPALMLTLLDDVISFCYMLSLYVVQCKKPANTNSSLEHLLFNMMGHIQLMLLFSEKTTYLLPFCLLFMHCCYCAKGEIFYKRLLDDLRQTRNWHIKNKCTRRQCVTMWVYASRVNASITVDTF